ncbi:hypothetical protein MAUB_52430 [Mycolicibacterium aubagnense]|uniref:Uncharacterized protein n=1 Tax=Mycolicibacterium aubagnense TaxID=319707 RepID=A0ABM7IKW3_9MYCO|nr:hypothetical protein MAUB_52430 [Mycolicibacterium aubagnense]
MAEESCQVRWTRFYVADANRLGAVPRRQVASIKVVYESDLISGTGVS